MFGHFQKQVTAWYGRLKINAAGTTKAPALEIRQDAMSTEDLLMAKKNDEVRFRIDHLGNIRFGGVYGVDYNYINFGQGQHIVGHSYTGQGITLYDGSCYHWFNSGHMLSNDAALGFMSGKSGVSLDTFWTRQGPGIIAQRGSAPSEYHLYGSYASSTAYQRLSTKAIREAVTCAAGAYVSTTISIPKYTHLVGVTTRVTTALGTGNGTTGYTVGDGTDADLWGAITGTAQGTTSDRRDFTAVDALGPDGADRTITLTAVGGNFDGTGVIEVCAYYLAAEAD